MSYQSIFKILEKIEKLVPSYINIPEDRNISNGNLAVCIIDEKGGIHSKMIGKDNAKLRNSYRVA